VQETMWGWTAEQWARKAASVLGAESVSARFVGSPWAVLQVAGTGRWVRASDGAEVVRYSDSPTHTIADEQLHDAHTAWGHALSRQVLRTQIVREWVEAGVLFDDVGSVWIDATVGIETGAHIGPAVRLLGATHVASGAHIQLGCHLTDTDVGEGAVVKPHTVAEGASIGMSAAVGPSAHLRAGAVLHAQVKVGNFVEVKKAVLHEGAKASHLSYIGDADIGPGANIGAGTITCNYDGYGKHRTQIGAGAFIGSNTALVAPVQVGDGAIVGAGSVITQPVPADCLAVERSSQRNLEGRAPRIRAANAKRAGKTP